MRILIIHNRYQDPGGEDAVFKQESKLLARVAEVETLEFFNRKGPRGWIQFAFYPWNIQAALRVKRHVRRFRPNVVHIHNLHYALGPLVIRMLRRLGVPIVLTLHNYRLLCPSATLTHDGHLFTESLDQIFPWSAIRQGVHRDSKIKTFWLAFTYAVHRWCGTWNMVDRYFVLTTFARELFVRYRNEIPSEKFVVKPNFLPDPGRPNQGNAEKQPHSRQQHFLYIGRLTEEKGLEILLKAFSTNGLSIRIAGDGPMRARVQSLADANPRIQYLGMLAAEDVLTEMRACSALIFPSIWYEGMPMTLIQAFATGTPVIASKMGAMETMIRPNIEGLLFEAGNPESLQNALELWKNCPDNSKMKISQQARIAYETHYTPAENERLLLAQYQSLIHK